MSLCRRRGDYRKVGGGTLCAGICTHPLPSCSRCHWAVFFGDTVSTTTLGVICEQLSLFTVVFDRKDCYILLSERDQLAIAKILVYKLITLNNVDIVFVAGCIIELNFVVDSSGSISDRNWGIVLEFVADIVQRLTIGPNDVRVAFVVFSTTANVEWGLSRYQDKASLLAAIRNVEKLGERTNLNQALYLTWSQVYREARPGVIKVTIILTDGEDNEPEVGTPLTLANATRCKTDGIRLIAVGVSSRINEQRLTEIASSPSDFLEVDDFNALNTVVEQLTSQACIVPTSKDRD